MTKLELKPRLLSKLLFWNVAGFFLIFKFQVLFTNMRKCNPFQNQVINEIRIFAVCLHLLYLVLNSCYYIVINYNISKSNVILLINFSLCFLLCA